MGAKGLRWVLTAGAWALWLAGCGAATVGPAGVAEPPTVSPLFGPVTTLAPRTAAEAGGEAPTISHYFRPETTTPGPTRTRRPAATPRPTTAPPPDDGPPVSLEAIVDLLIYDEVLAPGWSLEHSEGVSYDLADSRYAYEGVVSAAVTPIEDFGTFFFTVRENAPDDAGEPILRERVVGVRFWINGGAAEIAPADLALTIVGSDTHAYYDPADESVTMGKEDVFSETRLYNLSVNRTIPPETWIEISVRLDDLLYDPEYNYVTGLYIKNDAGFIQTFFVDHVVLVLMGE